MRRLLPLALALLAAACSASPCQELGERLCSCTGQASDVCKTQVEQQLESAGLDDATCEGYLRTCNASDTASLCERLLTADGKRDCGIAHDPAPAGSTL